MQGTLSEGTARAAQRTALAPSAVTATHTQRAHSLLSSFGGSATSDKCGDRLSPLFDDEWLVEEHARGVRYLILRT